jgi:monofunctional biosynthetic peptidoglycan transglycosylase
VPINSISNNIIFAVLASEDQRYFEHFGVDYVELEKVIHENIYKGQSRGASTITQQVAKNLFLFPQKLAVRKVFEIYYAYLIDFIWGKKRVLEVYLNIIQFGKKIYGVEAASLHYFNKDAKNVNINEASQIVAILPNPTRFNLKNKSKYLEKRISRIEKYSTKMNKQKIKELLDNY